MSSKGYSKHNLLLEPPLLVPPGYDWRPFEQWLDRNVMGVAGISWTNMCRVAGAPPCYVFYWQGVVLAEIYCDWLDNDTARLWVLERQKSESSSQGDVVSGESQDKETRDIQSCQDGGEGWPPPLARVLYSVLSGAGSNNSRSSRRNSSNPLSDSGSLDSGGGGGGGSGGSAGGGSDTVNNKEINLLPLAALLPVSDAALISEVKAKTHFDVSQSESTAEGKTTDD